MYDVISIGSSLVDIFVHSDELVLSKSSREGLILCRNYGGKVEVDSFKVDTGGGGSNTAVAFARAGFNVAVVSETGKDLFAKLVMEDYHDEKVSTNFVVQEKKEQTGGAVLLISAEGERTALVHRAAAAQLDPADIPTNWLQKSEWVHLSSISGRHDTLLTIFNALKKKKQLSWNPGKSELLLLAEGRLEVEQVPAQIMIFNKKEWRQVISVREKLLKLVPIIVVTNASKGGVVYTGERELKFPSSGIKAVETTGAGDSFCAGFVSAYIKQMPLEDCIKVGVKNAGSVVGQVGAKAGLLRKKQLLPYNFRQ